MNKQDKKIITDMIIASLQAFKKSDYMQAFNGYKQAVKHYNELCNESHRNDFTTLLKNTCKCQGVAFNAYNIEMFKEHKKAVAYV